MSDSTTTTDEVDELTFGGARSIVASPYHTDINRAKVEMSLPKNTGMSNSLACQVRMESFAVE
jgi:hypothetical protein